MTQQYGIVPALVEPSPRGPFRAEGARDHDRGLGLIEIVISMFLISLLAIAFVPVLVSALRASEVNSTAATATRMIAEAIDAARGAGAESCADAQNFLPRQADVVDAQGVTIRVETTIPATACVEGSALRVTVVAYDLADPDRTPIADARTLIFLGSTP